MSRKPFFSLLSAVTVVGLLAAAGALAAGVDLGLKDRLAAYGRADVFVRMDSEADLDAAQRTDGRVERIERVRDALITHAERSQAHVRRLLERRGVTYRPFWINNSIFIQDADAALVAALAKMDGVAAVRANEKVYLDPLPAEGEASPHAYEWGLETIGAPAVWEMGYTGEGVVVANIDTGVRYTHEALASQYRGSLGGGVYDHDYNWWDPSEICPADEPCDNNDHGTHTMGTMVGGDGPGPLANDIGVAPGATWIAAKGCESTSCSDFALISSAQWVLCPTRRDGSDPDCGKAPHLVNNSWGGGGGDSWYWSHVRAWLAAGIVPVFSAGNSGPGCATAGSPGDYWLVLSVGATDQNDRLASFSAKGPGAFGRLKPTLVAPGAAVRSSLGSGDAAYGSMSGTSMAAPHVAGTVALLLQADPGASRGDITAALVRTTYQTLARPPRPIVCDGVPYSFYPNFIYGFGRLDAFGALMDILGP